MATKKLKAELEIETEKAKQKMRGLEKSGGASSGMGTAADQASRHIRALGESAKTANVNMKGVVKAFGGMAVGLAGSYAAAHVRNPNVSAALDYAGSALAGASMGAMVGGPVGAAVGGAAGVAKTYLDREGERQKMSDDFEKSERIYAATKAKEDRFREITDVKKSGGVSASLNALKSDLANYEKSTAEFVARIREELKKANPDAETVSDLKRNVDFNRAQMERYRGAIRQLEEAQNKASDSAFRESMTATDALQKVGAGAAAGATPPAAAPARPAVSATPPAAAPARPAVSATPPAAAPARGGSFNFGFAVPTTKTRSFDFGGVSSESSLSRAMKIGNEAVERATKEQTEILKSIADGIRGNGGTTWQ